jgi:hypothetical protein
MALARRGVVRGSALLCSLALVACGGGGGNDPSPSPGNPHPAGSRTVTLTWDANRESAVNRAGGGYEVFINVDGNGCCSFDVPYGGGSAAPTSITVQLFPGRYLASVRAYGALNSSPASTTPVALDIQ